MDWILTLAIGLFGLALAMSLSSWAVDFTVFVFVFNRGLRRIVDYYVYHEFQAFSPISLSSLLVAASLLFAALVHFQRMLPAARIIVALLGASIAYAFLVGFVRIQVAAVYALAESLAALGLFAYVLVLTPQLPVKDRWVRSFAWAAILVSAYGWFQYLTIPPWDKFWLLATGMVGYMGIPEPTQMTVFSTMSERGVLAGFLGFSIVPMIVSKRWRPLPGILGWVGVVLVFSVILLTLSRGGVLFAAIGTACYLLINGGQGARQVSVGLIVLLSASWLGMSAMPNSARVTERFESLGHMQEDASLHGRLQILSAGGAAMLKAPQGFGLGAAGLASRVNTGSQATQASVVDAGWFNILLTYGIPGSFLLVWAMLGVWRLLSRRFQQPGLRDEHVLLARALMITLLPTCLAGDVLTGFSILWLALACGLLPSWFGVPVGTGTRDIRRDESGRAFITPRGGTAMPNLRGKERRDENSASSGFWFQGGSDSGEN